MRGNAICHCPNPDDAAWIAKRLNLAAHLERLAGDFAAGKGDGSDLVAFVQSSRSQQETPTMTEPTIQERLRDPVWNSLGFYTATAKEAADALDAAQAEIARLRARVAEGRG
ncbi:hypothetical protein AN189_10175 [Loktanella sp. 3ANDIMAR09]|nr:hypothetical protein AN189_10175 [Loktanella sp. 3ANDIMAR09]